MESKLVALKLVLDELGIDSGISTVDDRKRVQKTVYLEQLRGVDLGYRFSWYLMGPYSPSLTRDYYALAQELETGDVSHTTRALKPHLRDRLRDLRSLLSQPDDFPLEQEDWLELLASYHYLRQIRRKDDAQAVEILRQEKPALASFHTLARRELSSARLI